MLYPSVFGSLSAALKERQVQEILGMNEESAKFGLALTRTDVEEIIEERNRALQSYGRVELSLEVTGKIIGNFGSSPFIRQEDYVATLKDLQEIFYYLKNETEETIGDDELIAVMKDFFDNSCEGSIELLKGTALEEFARKVRYPSSPPPPFSHNRRRGRREINPRGLIYLRPIPFS